MLTRSRPARQGEKPEGGRPRARSRAAARLAGLVVVALCVAVPALAEEPAAEPVDPADVRALVRTGQLAEWGDKPLSQAQSLCVQRAFAPHWPQTGLKPDSERDEDALRQAREQCVVVYPELLDAGDFSSRLVAGAREQFQGRLKRLFALRLALGSCLQLAGVGTVDEACLSRVVGEALSPPERQWLLIALRTKP